jgi:hypothetical protein
MSQLNYLPALGGLAPDAASGLNVCGVMTSEQADAPGKLWKVGALARASGLTVRALHHYDQIGLLKPSRRSSAGHRLYSTADVTRLCARLTTMAAELARQDNPSAPQLFSVLEEMTMFDRTLRGEPDSALAMLKQVRTETLAIERFKPVTRSSVCIRRVRPHSSRPAPWER